MLSLRGPDKVRDICSKSSAKVSGVYLDTFRAPSATSDSQEPLEKYSCCKKEISKLSPLSNSLENLNLTPSLSLEL